MKVTYKKTADGKYIRIKKETGLITEEEITQEEYESDKLFSTIASLIVVGIIFLVIFKACVGGNNDSAEVVAENNEPEEEDTSSLFTENEEIEEYTYYIQPGSEDEDEDEDENEIEVETEAENEENEENDKENDKENDADGKMFSQMIKDVKDINEEYDYIYTRSWVIVQADIKKNFLHYEHINIMDDAYIDYDELAYQIELIDYVNDLNVNNKDSLKRYFENIKEAAIAKGYASMYYSYMIDDALMDYQEDPNDERKMNGYLFDADDYYDEAMHELDEFAKANDISF